MVLILYHDNKKPQNIFNVIRVTVDDLRTVAVKTKYRSEIKTLSFRHEKDYQRLTVQDD